MPGTTKHRFSSKGDGDGKRWGQQGSWFLVIREHWGAEQGWQVQPTRTQKAPRTHRPRGQAVFSDCLALGVPNTAQDMRMLKS